MRRVSFQVYDFCPSLSSVSTACLVLLQTQNMAANGIEGRREEKEVEEAEEEEEEDEEEEG